MQEKSNTKIEMNSQKGCGDMIKHSSTLSGPKENINYVKANKEIPIATKMAAQLNNGILPPNYRKGAIPKYDIIQVIQLNLYINIFKSKNDHHYFPN